MALTRVRTVWTGVPGTPWYSNHYFDVDAGDAQTCTDAIIDFWSDTKAAQSSLVNWTVENSVTVLNPANGQPTDVITTVGATDNGDGSGDMVTRASQILISWRTGVFLAGRELRGKTFVPAVVSSTIDGDGGVESAVVVQFLGYADALLTTPGHPNLQVWSRKNGTVTPVSSVQVSTEWAVLRSRRD